MALCYPWRQWWRPVYAPASQKRRGRIAVVGKTLLFGPAVAVKKVRAARLGKAPRMVESSSLAKTVKTLRAAQPKASSFLVVDVAAVRKKIKGALGAWEKELHAGALFFTDGSLVALVKGEPKRIALLATLARGMMTKAAKALSRAKAEIAKAGGPAATQMLDELGAALKTTTLRAKGDTLTVEVKASPVKVMTAAGMIAYLMLVRRGAPSPPPARAAAPHSAAP